MKHHGAPPHAHPWPEGEQYDPELLLHGDTRNVPDRYRYWTLDAIRKDLDRTGSGLEIAVENLERDFNMGTIVRTANAFNIRTVHVIGRRQWNKRGAMKTDAYLAMHYHESVQDFMRAVNGRAVLAIDNTPGAQDISTAELPANAVLVFGSEGAGLSDELLAAAHATIQIEQFGSTRSLNVGVAAGIVMYEWMRRNMLTPL